MQAWVNAFWDLDTGAEAWPDPAAFGAWLRARGFTDASPGAAELADAITAREALRTILLAHHDGGEPDRALATLDEIAARRGASGGLTPCLQAGHLDTDAGGVDAAFALLLAIVVEAKADGTWLRLKACPHEHCGWAFYDASRNRSSQWCSMRLCGNRTKGERFRRRNLKPEAA